MQSISGRNENATRALRLIFYLGEIERQAEIFSACLMDSFSAAERDDVGEAWRHLQAAMFAAIIVSRLLSADQTAYAGGGLSREDAKEAMRWRVTELRQLLGMPEASTKVVSVDRIADFRNGLEHIDQRIDIAVLSPSVASLTDWYLTEGLFLTSPEEAPKKQSRAGLRGFYAVNGMAMFDRSPVDLFELDLDMIRLRHNAREVQVELCADVIGRCAFGGPQLRDYQPKDLDVSGRQVGHRRLIGESPPSALWRRRVL